MSAPPKTFLIMNKNIFITGGTGYIGSRVIPLLLQKGYNVFALVRKGSEGKLPKGCNAVTGNALDGSTFADKISPCDTFIQLVGVAHPGPGKAEQFNKIDMVSVRESVKAAKDAGVKHFIYLSVAEPAPTMHEYIVVRRQGEEMITQSGMNGTFIKPWYVLGPGHWWPYLILPMYKLFQLIPWTRETAKRLYPVKLRNVLNAIVHSVESPAQGIRKFMTQDLLRF
jgi:uncharacterized protein YbjT (DUF2867 family)